MQAVQLVQVVQLVLSAALVALLTPQVSSKADVKLQLKQYFFNPSVVHYRGHYITTARTAFMKGVAGRWWWFNDGYLCAASEPTLAKHQCTRMDPWAGEYKECLWSGLVDTMGLEDPKLFVWPGRGLFALVNRKPSRASADRRGVCRWDVPWLTQYLFPVLLDTGAGEWALQKPVQLQVAVPGFYQHQQEKKEIVKEKNWMPFLWHDQLYMVHSTFPQHRVIKIPPDGVATRQYVTDSSNILHKLNGKEIHGSSPVVLIPSSTAPEESSYRVDSSGSSSNNSSQGYYLGVLHYFTHEKTQKTDIKRYHHYFYKFKRAPPFAVCAISAEIPLVFRKGKIDLTETNPSTSQHQPRSQQHKQQRIWKDTTQTAFVNGLFLKQRTGAAGQGASGNRLLVSYGSSDIDARLLVLSVPEVEAMFMSPHDCSVVQPLAVTEH